MGRLLRLLFGLDLPVSRRTYVVAGSSLATLKYLLDAGAAYVVTGALWTPWRYLESVTLHASPPGMGQPLITPSISWLEWGIRFAPWHGHVRERQHAGHASRESNALARGNCLHAERAEARSSQRILRSSLRSLRLCALCVGLLDS